MLAELRGVRERTLAFIEETRGRELSKYWMAHPFVGSLKAYPWLQFLAAHEKRSIKQMREIAGTLPKTVTSLHMWKIFATRLAFDFPSYHPPELRKSTGKGPVYWTLGRKY
jgi:hypothetical protein